MNTLGSSAHMPDAGLQNGDMSNFYMSRSLTLANQMSAMSPSPGQPAAILNAGKHNFIHFSIFIQNLTPNLV